MTVVKHACWEKLSDAKQHRRGRKGGLKGRDLSGLDCVLIEVTCIKWNLIGTDTGSLTDRHDADGLSGGERGSERDGEGKRDWRQRGSAVWERQNGGERNIFLHCMWPNGKGSVHGLYFSGISSSTSTFKELSSNSQYSPIHINTLVAVATL